MIVSAVKKHRDHAVAVQTVKLGSALVCCEGFIPKRLEVDSIQNNRERIIGKLAHNFIYHSVSLLLDPCINSIDRLFFIRKIHTPEVGIIEIIGIFHKGIYKLFIFIGIDCICNAEFCGVFVPFS